MELSYFTYTTEIGDITIQSDKTAIKGIFFGNRSNLEGIRREDSLIKVCRLQLEEYFLGRRKIFEFPLDPDGSVFQKKVWKALLEIPYGETRSYGEIAKNIGNPKASRAVGMANNKNPLAIVVPCHRVIGSNGKMVGYGGGIPIKQYLLELERR